jgi:hypothetical protein
VTVLRSTIDIASPPGRVWDLIARFEHWPAWGTTVEAVEPPAGQVRVGVKGRVKTIVGPWLPFEITAVIEGVSWGWKVAGIPATGHQIEPIDTGCRVTFTAPVWAPFYLPVLHRALVRLERSAHEP